MTQPITHEVEALRLTPLDATGHPTALGDVITPLVPLSLRLAPVFAPDERTFLHLTVALVARLDPESGDAARNTAATIQTATDGLRDFGLEVQTPSERGGLYGYFVAPWVTKTSSLAEARTDPPEIVLWSARTRADSPMPGAVPEQSEGTHTRYMFSAQPPLQA
ncbi:hypothetical protein [Streptomyces albidoflavus]|uniref:hypothetical protein n=1 Tax=Streptomyces albidoflavus TaxID=1886 RepID=UPI001022A079|nr:hypothetical protein [Streptomyces albidoflavus]RZF02925.1 hypothetical protein C0R05_32460 [Streptomyces albidoflavus]